MHAEHDGAAAPLILTLDLDREASTHFEALRQRHFPAHRNQIPAHLTLFHKLPGEEEQSIARLLTKRCVLQGPIALIVNDVRLLGRGVAYRMDAGALQRLRGDLSAVWRPWLTPQDLQGFRPHVVVQNKAEPSVARALHAELAGRFRPYSVTATGLHLWRYLGGPWESVASYPFLGS